MCNSCRLILVLCVVSRLKLCSGRSWCRSRCRCCRLRSGLCSCSCVICRSRCGNLRDRLR